MCRVNIYELKTNLSKYLDLLEKGKEDEVIICRFNKEIAKITLMEPEYEPICGAGKDIPGIDKIKDIKKGFEDIPELFGY